MKLFQAYQNQWAIRIPISHEGKVVKFIIGGLPDLKNWGFSEQRGLDDELDIIFHDGAIVDIPRAAKFNLITDVFVRGVYKS